MQIKFTFGQYVFLILHKDIHKLLKDNECPSAQHIETIMVHTVSNWYVSFSTEDLCMDAFFKLHNNQVTMDGYTIGVSQCHYRSLPPLPFFSSSAYFYGLSLIINNCGIYVNLNITKREYFNLNIKLL